MRCSVPGTRTLITRAEVDLAKRGHNCKRNQNHRIEQGCRRLKIRNGRSWDHYCMQCAKLIIERDMAKLETLAQEVTASG